MNKHSSHQQSINALRKNHNREKRTALIGLVATCTDNLVRTITDKVMNALEGGEFPVTLQLNVTNVVDLYLKSEGYRAGVSHLTTHEFQAILEGTTLALTNGVADVVAEVDDGLGTSWQIMRA